jgi:mannose-6-phosphate isomerase-like protein (cupin superfamily)
MDAICLGVLRLECERMSTVVAPWGRHEIIADPMPGLRVKVLHITPGHRTSLQRHAHRREVLVVTKGVATVDALDSTVPHLWRLHVGETATIPPGVWHRLGGVSRETEAVLVEVQTGLPDEDDIERAEDDYGRAG